MINLNRNMKYGRWILGWGATARCDLACPFCYSKQNREMVDSKDVNLHIAEQFLIRNSEIIKSLNFGTGESFLMPDFPKLLSICKSVLPEAKIAVTTNGSIVDHITNIEEYKLYKMTIDELDVSLDFYESQRHNTFRGKQDSWDRAISAIEIGKKLQMDVSIVMVGTPETMEIGNLFGMLSLARHFDVALRINLYMPTTGDFSFALSFSQLRSSLLYLLEHSDSLQTSDPLLFAIMNSKTEVTSLKNYSSLRILPNSFLSPSTYLVSEPWAQKVNLDNLELNAFAEFSNINQWFNAPLPTECKNCIIQNLCGGGSKERRILWYGTLRQRDPYCPLRNKQDLPSIMAEMQSHKLVSQCNWRGPTVHLEYLPTIICFPSKKIEDKEVNTLRCAKAMFIDSNQKVLVVRKASNGQWELPGGRVCIDEMYLECLHRELVEELGYRLQKVPDEVVKWSAFVENNTLLGQTFFFQVDNFSPNISGEHTDYKWIPLDSCKLYLKSVPHYGIELYKIIFNLRYGNI